MNEKENIFQKNSDKWWMNWWKNRFSTSNDSNSINFHPGTNFLADKLGINSIKGFIFLVILLILIGLGIRFGIDYFFPSQTNSPSNIYQNRGSQIAQSWISLPEIRPMILGIFIVCIIGALIVWWIFYRDN